MGLLFLLRKRHVNFTRYQFHKWFIEHSPSRLYLIKYFIFAIKMIVYGNRRISGIHGWSGSKRRDWYRKYITQKCQTQEIRGSSSLGIFKSRHLPKEKKSFLDLICHTHWLCVRINKKDRKEIMCSEIFRMYNHAICPPSTSFSQLLHTLSGKIFYMVIIMVNENVETDL